MENTYRTFAKVVYAIHKDKIIEWAKDDSNTELKAACLKVITAAQDKP